RATPPKPADPSAVPHREEACLRVAPLFFCAPAGPARGRMPEGPRGRGLAMAYLIDGYNLLYALGVLHDRMGPTGLRKARLRPLGLLRAALGPDEASAVTVVFDAAKAPPGVSAEEDYGGIHVRFAVHQEEADDLIEELIRHDSAPRNLTVVSNDHRIQQAA